MSHSNKIEVVAADQNAFNGGTSSDRQNGENRNVSVFFFSLALHVSLITAIAAFWCHSFPKNLIPENILIV